MDVLAPLLVILALALVVWVVGAPLRRGAAPPLISASVMRKKCSSLPIR